MANDYIAKLKQLSPGLQTQLSDENFLADLDKLDEQYGVKAVLILLGLLLKEIDYSGLAGRLKADYGLNDFLAEEIKAKFGELIKKLGENEPASVVKPQGGEGAMPKPALARPLAGMTFSRADEDEVRQYIKATPQPKIDHTAMAQKIISMFGYPAADEIMLKRLENIVSARIRDIRDDLETKESLMKSQRIGGLELSEADVDRLLGLIKNAANQNARDSSTTLRGVYPEYSRGSRNDNYRDRVSVANRPTIAMEDGLPVVQLPGQEENQPFFERAFGAERLPEAADDDKMKAETREILPPPTPQPYIAEKIIPESVLNAKTASRPNLDDVKLEKKLAGPVEELETMTIIDFRRLAADPTTAVNKIKEKIDLLENDSFNQKLNGIAAWQTSEVSRFYRLLGQLSMSENKNIEEVIKERLISGKPTLSLDEFHAVMELNRALRY